jgi:hypothetical protein
MENLQKRHKKYLKLKKAIKIIKNFKISKKIPKK